MKAVGIIQARMGSSRLPGKTLLPLGNRTILTYLVERLKRSRTLDDVIVATTLLSRDDVIVAECEQHGIAWFRGSESDVLGRYLGAAIAMDAEIVVRITADNPFTDPESIDRVVRHIRRSGARYVIEDRLPVGTTGEALTVGMLAFIDKVATEPALREHVTLYAKRNRGPGAVFLAPPAAYDRPSLPLTVDEHSDYERVFEIAAGLGGLDFDLSDLIRQADQLLPESVLV